MDSQQSLVNMMKPYHVRMADDVPWQQYFMIMNKSSDHGIQEGVSGLIIQHLSDSTNTMHPVFGYNYMNTPKVEFEDEILLDEVNKKVYFIHSPFDSNVIIREATVEITKESNGSRTITDIESVRLFRAHLPCSPPPFTFSNMIHWFLNTYDGSIFQIRSSFNMSLFHQDVTTFHTLSWIRLDDSVQIDAPYSGISYAGKAKVMDKYEFVFPRASLLRPSTNDGECAIQFSRDGQKLLLRFRMPNPELFSSAIVPDENGRFEILEALNSPNSTLAHQMNQPPTYALFALDYDSHTIQLLTQLVPSSQENHVDFLISSQLLSIYANGMGFSNSEARPFLSQQSHMVGQYLKYTFFTTVNKEAIGVVAVKSFMKTLQNGQFSLTPKKVWFPLEDEKLKQAFEQLSEKMIKWEMLVRTNNIMLVVEDEFILQVCHPAPSMKPMGSIRVKLGDNYKDYRKCAGCGKIEEHKRRNKNGKRISKFIVCRWCKNRKLHKLWWQVPCHVCSKECGTKNWPKHQLEHKKQIKGN